MSGQDKNGPAPTATALVGTYRCSEEGVVVTLRLDADGRFEERMEGDGMREEGNSGVPVRPHITSGRWQVEGWMLRLSRQPAQPSVDQTARIADARGQAVIVPFGITGAVLRRVTNDR
ncbi:hypothetical protein [Sphingomonas arantia]|uniref:hypothetical protein n=1 Tax=Sphingomonas arantia TaxID=1460676 RepID=UPI0036D2D17D